MLDTDWCCSADDCNGLWFNSRHPEQDWLDAWSRVAALSKPFKARIRHSSCKDVIEMAKRT